MSDGGKNSKKGNSEHPTRARNLKKGNSKNILNFFLEFQKKRAKQHTVFFSSKKTNRLQRMTEQNFSLLDPEDTTKLIGYGCEFIMLNMDGNSSSTFLCHNEVFSKFAFKYIKMIKNLAGHRKVDFLPAMSRYLDDYDNGGLIPWPINLCKQIEKIPDPNPSTSSNEQSATEQTSPRKGRKQRKRIENAQNGSFFSFFNYHGNSYI